MPLTVVPNQCCADGGARVGKSTPLADAWLNPYGAISPAKTATTTKNSTSSTPARSMPRWNPAVARSAASPGMRVSRRSMTASVCALSGSAVVISTSLAGR